MPRLHATTVAIDGRGVLIEGPSGAGKSDLALRLIDRGAQLVSDDYTQVQRSGDVLIATAPDTIMGQMEVRGIGIVDMLGTGPTPVALIVELAGEAPRMPEPRHRDIDGVTIAAVTLDAFTASAPIKVELALRRGLPA